MNLDILQLESFVVGDNRPWLENQTNEVVFRSKLGNIIEADMPDSLVYNFDFQRPISEKTKYFQRLIHNAFIEDYSSIYYSLEQDDDERVIKYILDKILNKKLKTKINQIGVIIREHDYNLAYINPATTTAHLEQEVKDNIFITQLLKNTLIILYLNIQEKYKSYINDFLEPEDFYTQILLEPIPSILPFRKTQIVEAVEVPIQLPTTKIKRPIEEPNSFTYLVKQDSEDKLRDAFDRLRSKKFIDESTTLPNFKRIFSGREISTPIKWIANNSDLYYFIKLLYSEEKLVKDLKQKQWKVAEKCFVNSEGNLFDMSMIKTLKKPATTAEFLEMLVSGMK